MMERKPTKIFAGLALAAALVASGAVSANWLNAKPEAAAPGEPAGPQTPLEPLPDPWAGLQRMTVLDWDGDIVYMFDVLCATGGSPRFDREGPILAGAGALRAQIEIGQGALYSGLRLGYVVDANHPYDQTGSDKPITWLPPVFAGEDVFTIPVGPDQAEADEKSPRWDFYVELNPGMDDLCYTGFATGSARVLVDALRGPGHECAGGAKEAAAC